MEEMKYERNRLASFRTFPRQSPVYATRLARVGFYYDGNEDSVVCFSCGVRHSNWKCGDVAADVHRHISPDCHFINDRDPRNVPISNVATRPEINRHEALPHNHNCSGTCATCNISDTQTNNRLENNHSVDARGQSLHIADSNSGVFSSFERGRHAQQSSDSTPLVDTANSFSWTPKYPGYADLPSRISSFDSLPMPSEVHAHTLARAGLFYVGFGDCVRCFFCGGGLRNREPQDDPWVEHARWFSRCPYVIQSHGNEFVHVAHHLVLEQQFGSMSFTPEAGDDKVSLTLNDVDEHNESELNNSIAAQSVMEMGYSLDTVQDAVRQMEQRGTALYNAEAIMEFILENEAEQLSLVRLVEENRQLREQRLCIVCYTEPRCILLLPCRHLVLCHKCSTKLTCRKCPICRETITRTVRTYIT